MRNRFETLFAKVRERKRPAFAAYVTAGDPDLSRTNDICLALAGAGVEIIEYGIPFSDPIADGPVIQKAAARSLANGTSVDGILGSLADLRAQGCEAAISLFSAYNIYLHRGLETMAADARDAGADGLLIPDIPPEEGAEVLAATEKAGIGCTFLCAPTSSDERIRLIAEACRGYMYCVALRGVTGARAELPPDLIDFLKRIRAQSAIPTMVGFGISTPEHVAHLAPHVDAMVVGSAIVKLIEENAGKTDLPERVAAYASEMVAALG